MKQMICEKYKCHRGEHPEMKNLDLGFALSYDITYVRSPEMTTLSATEARKRLYTLVDEVQETHEPIQIMGKRNAAILLSEKDWRAIQETLYLVSIPGMRKSIKKGLETPVEECDEEPGW